MRRIINKHQILIIGTLLPLVLVLFFAIASALPQWLVNSPEYDLLYLISPYPHDGLSTDISDGKLKLLASPLLKKGHLPMPRLFRYEVKARTSIEIPLKLSPLSENPDTSEQLALNVPAVQNLVLDSNTKSPDGYKAQFSSPPYLNGIVNFMLLNNYSKQFIIAKKGKNFNIFDEAHNSYNYTSVKFIGWVVSDKGLSE